MRRWRWAWLSLILLLCCSQALAGTWSQVNSKTGACSSSPATCAAAAFTNALTNGSVIFANVFGFVPSGSPSYSVTDTAGNTYNDCGPGIIKSNSSQDTSQCFYALNTHTTASNVVTMHNGSNVANVINISANEYPNTDGAITTLDGTCTSTTGAVTSGTGANNMTCSAQITTTADNDLLVGLVTAGNGVVSAGTGYTLDAAANGTDNEHQVQTTHGAISVTSTSNQNADPYEVIGVAVKNPSTGSSVPQVFVIRP